MTLTKHNWSTLGSYTGKREQRAAVKDSDEGDSGGSGGAIWKMI